MDASSHVDNTIQSLGGNGVDPLVAAVAFRVLWDRAADRYRVKGDAQ